MSWLLFPVNNSTSTGVVEITPAFLDMVKRANDAAQDEKIMFLTTPWPVQVYVGEWSWYNWTHDVQPCPTLRSDKAVTAAFKFWGDGRFSFRSMKYTSDDPVNIEWMEAQLCAIC